MGTKGVGALLSVERPVGKSGAAAGDRVEDQEELAAASHAVFVRAMRLGAGDCFDALPFLQARLCLLYRVFGHGQEQMLHSLFLCSQANSKSDLCSDTTLEILRRGVAARFR